jgi:flagellar motor protein MotB
MKRLSIFILPALLCFSTVDSYAQLGGIGNRIKQKVKQRVDRRFDQAVDHALDKTEGEIIDAADGDGQQPGETLPENPNAPTEAAPPAAAGGATNAPVAVASAGSASFAVNTKFDYVPGETLLVYEDFEQDAVGDFPARWNTDGTGEVVTLGNSSEKWLLMKSGSDFIPDLPRDLPEEYTIEFDLNSIGIDKKTASSTLLEVTLDDNNGFKNGRNRVSVRIPFCQYHPVGFNIRNFTEEGSTINNNVQGDIRQQVLNQPHISIAVNKTRFRLWVNEKKYVDVPRLVPAGNKIVALKLKPYYFKDGKEDIFIRNLKIAEGGLDLRGQLLRDGMVSTNGILFDVNSANIQPESYGVLRQIALAMQENTDMKLNIIGHTDSDGADGDNMNLSQQRAQAVKNALAEDFGIAADRLTVEGKGESQPVAENETPEGKAANRRVEFVSL